MDNVNYNPPMLRHIVKERLLARDPLMLLDIGCGLGIDPVWRFFGDGLQAHGFDPLEHEIEKLNRNEQSPNVRYHAGFVGLPASDPFHAARRVDTSSGQYFAPSSSFSRSSCYAANQRKQANTPAHPAEPGSSRAESLVSTEQWNTHQLAARTIAISDFVNEQQITNIDFVKTDTDGRDLEAVASCEQIIRRTGVLGFMVECFFGGSLDSTENSFHNVDAFMRRNGFVLYALSINRYSRAALPAMFLYPALYQTISGQPNWGDMIYLRDGASPDYAKVWGDELSVTKLLKLASLYELFRLPDCAAELIVTHRDRLRQIVDPAVLLDLLTPPLGGVQRSYREYLQLFEDDVEAFYPAS